MRANICNQSKLLHGGKNIYRLWLNSSVATDHGLSSSKCDAKSHIKVTKSKFIVACEIYYS